MLNRHALHISLAVGLALAALILLIANLHPTAASSSTVLVSAVYYDTYLSGEPDESFRLINISASAVDLTNWTIGDGEGIITLTGQLSPGSSIWVANQAMSFTLESGFPPDFEYGADSDPAVPNLGRRGTVSLSNDGDELVLQDSAGAIVDSVVWEGGDPAGTGWVDETIVPYDQGFFGIEGQILYRKLDQQTGRPVPDTDTASDWAQATDDNINGKKVMYPGWDLERYFQTAVVTYLIAPDNIFANVRQVISSATTSIRYEGYTLNNAELGQALAARAAAGVSVTVLLEGAPVGGVGDQDRWVCQQIENAGGQCWFMINDLQLCERHCSQPKPGSGLPARQPDWHRDS
jgi:cardiolipin synthase